MARQYTTSDGVTMIIPDSSVSVNVISNPQGLSTTGVMVLVGEAEEGPHWSEESKLSNNSYGPGDINKVAAKYGSGRLVDAFRGAVSASNSAKIQGAVNSLILVKSNQGSAASKVTNDGHGSFSADLKGAGGNGISETISTKQSEAAPSTGAFSYVPSTSAVAMNVRINGGAKQVLSIAAGESPATLAAALTGLANVNVVGGVDRLIMAGLSAANQAGMTVSGQNVTISLSTPSVFGNSPQVGDTVQIASGSILAGAGNANVGWYLVTSTSNSSAAASIGAVKIGSAPVAVSPAALSATPANDLQCFAYMRIDNVSGTDRGILAGLVSQSATVSVAGAALTFSLNGSAIFAALPKIGDLVHIPAGSAFQGAANANVGWYSVTAVSNTSGSAFITASRLSNGNPVAVSLSGISAVSDVACLAPQIKGAGKALEISDAAGAANINTVFMQLGVQAAPAWLQSVSTSSAELQKQFNVTKSSKNIIESFVAGGNVALAIGYKGVTATASVVSSSNQIYLQTSVTGGVGSALNLNLSNISTMNDLVQIISAQPGYSASLGAAVDGQRNPAMILDEVSNIGICSDLANGKPGRIKRDIWDITSGPNSINQTSVLVTYTPAAVAGLPEDEGPVFLSGGAKGATSALAMANAINALANVRCNFVVPLVSQDASVDAPLGLTDPNSSYTVDAANAAVRAHVVAMSTPKVKRHRLALVSKKDTFANQMSAAQTMASFRVGMLFQDIKDNSADGTIQTFQPWMAAAKAAGLQAAGFYKSIFNKSIQISGLVNPVGWDDQNQADLERALLAGLIPMNQESDGSFIFTSDQMTYGTDNNFVYNSLQAVYVADIIALSLAEACKNAFVGESVADVTPAVAVSFIKGKMEEFLKKKLTVSSPSQGAPGGWSAIKVDIADGVMEIRCTVVEATSIYFVPINVDIEGLKSSASA